MIFVSYPKLRVDKTLARSVLGCLFCGQKGRWIAPADQEVGRSRGDGFD